MCCFPSMRNRKADAASRSCVENDWPASTRGRGLSPSHSILPSSNRQRGNVSTELGGPGGAACPFSVRIPSRVNAPSEVLEPAEMESGRGDACAAIHNPAPLDDGLSLFLSVVWA